MQNDQPASGLPADRFASQTRNRKITEMGNLLDSVAQKTAVCELKG